MEKVGQASHIPDEVSNSIIDTLAKIQETLKEQLTNEGLSEAGALNTSKGIIDKTDFPHPGMGMMLEKAIIEACAQTPTVLVEQICPVKAGQQAMDAVGCRPSGLAL